MKVTTEFLIREATLEDIPQMQLVRNSVVENVLSNPDLVRDEHYAEFINGRGKGWVCETNDRIVGFAFADLSEHNIWALFVLPQFEKLGIGRLLHDTMLDWYFGQTKTTVWLSTSPNTRAEKFYDKAGWTKAGSYGNNEVKFEMKFQDWLAPDSF